MTYLLYQKERCPTTGALHLQGCLRTPKVIRLQALKDSLGEPTIHLEPASNWAKVKSYCRKQETRVEGPWEHGTDVQGRRSDLAIPCQMVLAGKREREIAELHPEVYVKYFKGIQQLQRIVTRAEPREKRVALFWGATGTGKTRMVYDNTDTESLYNVFCTKSPWFDGYNGHRTVLLDECGPGMMNINIFKRILDRYPMEVPVKGGCVKWNPEVVVMTSNDPLEEWYPTASRDNLNAIKRRVTIFKFPEQKWLAEAWIRGGGVETRTWGLPEPTQVDSETEPDAIDLYDVLHRENAVS